jgi:Cu2+-exporting ATPase
MSAHPASKALVAALDRQALPSSAWSDVHEAPGQGVLGRYEDEVTYRLGSAAWVAGSRTAGTIDADVWFGPEGEVLARFEVAEVVRADASATVQRLRESGVRVGMLSGDAPARATAMGVRLGLDEARGGVTPEIKLATVVEAQAAGHVVAMVGDGVNDAPVLARADVSFAFAHGAAVSKLHADAIVLSERLGSVADARDHAQRTMRVLRQNLAWAALYNAVCIPLALAGWLPPWAAGLGMATSSLVVVLNSLRLSRLPA